MLNPDTWLRRQVWQLLWRGPGAVSAYWSIPLPLVCAALSLAGPPELAVASFCILSVNVLLGVLLILADEIGSCPVLHQCVEAGLGVGYKIHVAKAR